jgi:hypothetical protein
MVVAAFNIHSEETDNKKLNIQNLKGNHSMPSMDIQIEASIVKGKKGIPVKSNIYVAECPATNKFSFLPP